MKKISFTFTLFILLSLFTRAQAAFWSITADNILPNSVTLEASNLTPGGSYTFSVTEKNNTPHYTGSSITATADINGLAQASFSGLEGGSDYSGNIEDMKTKMSIPVTFSTSLDITVLSRELSHAQDLYNNAVEGTQHGDYNVGSKAVFKTTIDEANCMVSGSNNSSTTLNGVTCPASFFLQNDIDNEVNKLTKAVALFITQEVASSPWVVATANLQPTSVTLKASNLNPNTQFELIVYSLYQSVAATSYNQTVQVTSDANGLAQADFSGLQPSVSYIAGVQDPFSTVINPNSGASSNITTITITFVTPSTITTITPTTTPTNNIITSTTSNTGKNLVPVCNTKFNSSKGTYDDPCDFNMVMKLINNVINFLLVVIASPLAALVIAYAGFLMLTAGGSSEKVTKAKGILKNIVIGYIIALAAWLIVHTILSALGFNGSMFLSS